MLKLLNRKGQNTAEYAILIAVVIGAIIAMQLYVKRGLQGKVRAVTDHVGDGLLDVGYTDVPVQYEPYYNESSYSVSQDSAINEKFQTGGQVDRSSISEKTIRTGFSKTGVDQAGDDAWK